MKQNIWLPTSYNMCDVNIYSTTRKEGINVYCTNKGDYKIWVNSVFYTNN